MASMSRAQNQVLFVTRKCQKEIISFQKHFILSKYLKFWLSYNFLSCLIFYCQRGPFPTETADKSYGPKLQKKSF